MGTLQHRAEDFVPLTHGPRYLDTEGRGSPRRVVCTGADVTPTNASCVSPSCAAVLTLTTCRRYFARLITSVTRLLRQYFELCLLRKRESDLTASATATYILWSSEFS